MKPYNFLETLVYPPNPWNRTICSPLDFVNVIHIDLPLPMCVRTLLRRKDKDDSGLLICKPTEHTAENELLFSVIPSYNQDLSSDLLRNTELFLKEVREMERERADERDEGVKQLIWMIIWLDCEMKRSMWELEPLLILPLSLNAGLQQVYRKCCSILIHLFHFIFTEKDEMLVFPEVSVSGEVNSVELEVN